MTPNDSSDDVLAVEAILFSRYLLQTDPPAEMIERYVAGDRLLFPDQPPESDVAVVAFARSHPAAVSLLDAATALLMPDALLRKKILLMAAILETSPRYADEFLPRAVPPLRLFFSLCAWTLTSAFKVVLGMPLLLLARRTRP